MARMPVIRKLGTMVMAGSHAFQLSSGTQGGPMEAIIGPSGRAGPWRISKTPCSMPAPPAVKPSTVAVIRVAVLIPHLLLIDRRS